MTNDETDVLSDGAIPDAGLVELAAALFQALDAEESNGDDAVNPPRQSSAQAEHGST